MGTGICPEPKYSVGDKVVISEGVIDCEFGFSDEMEQMIGKEMTISAVYWLEYRMTYEYRLREDPSGWSWCEKCFTKETPFDLPEFDASANILDLLS